MSRSRIDLKRQSKTFVATLRKSSAVVLTFLVVSCGGGGGEQTANTNTTKPVTATPVPPSTPINTNPSTFPAYQSFPDRLLSNDEISRLPLAEREFLWQASRIVFQIYGSNVEYSAGRNQQAVAHLIKNPSLHSAMKTTGEPIAQSIASDVTAYLSGAACAEEQNAILSLIGDGTLSPFSITTLKAIAKEAFDNSLKHVPVETADTYYTTEQHRKETNGTLVDAYRHIYLSASLTGHYGHAAAEKITTAHECSKQDYLALMDYHNNAIGHANSYLGLVTPASLNALIRNTFETNGYKISKTPPDFITTTNSPFTIKIAISDSAPAAAQLAGLQDLENLEPGETRVVRGVYLNNFFEIQPIRTTGQTTKLEITQDPWRDRTGQVSTGAFVGNHSVFDITVRAPSDFGVKSTYGIKLGDAISFTAKLTTKAKPVVGCQSQQVQWSGAGVCNSTLPASNDGKTFQAFATSGKANDRATYICTNGTWVGPQNASCEATSVSPTNCAATLLSWNSGGNSCSASASTTSAGNSVSLLDVTEPTTGRADFTCSELGAWGSPRNQTCSSTPPPTLFCTGANGINYFVGQTEILVCEAGLIGQRSRSCTASGWQPISDTCAASPVAFALSNATKTGNLQSVKCASGAAGCVIAGIELNGTGLNETTMITFGWKGVQGTTKLGSSDILIDSSKVVSKTDTRIQVWPTVFDQNDKAGVCYEWTVTARKGSISSTARKLTSGAICKP